METQQNRFGDNNSNPQHLHSGHIAGGILLLGIGVIWMAHQAGVDFPHWLTSWPMIVIAIGLFIGVRSHFRNPGFIMPILVGGVFLADQVVTGINLHDYLVPVIIIAVGLSMVLHSMLGYRTRGCGYRPAPVTIDNNVINSSVFMGEENFQLLAKDFRGGRSTSVFGKTVINLKNADISGRVNLQLNQVFGSVVLLVPPTWNIETQDIVTIFGGVQGKRITNYTETNQDKVLVLTGINVFGGIEIKGV